MGELIKEGGGLALVVSEVQSEGNKMIPISVQRILDEFPETSREMDHLNL